jgi:hypothetical protein
MKNPVRLLRCIAVGMLALNFVGCASIVHSGNRRVTIDSDPQGATVTITGKHGWELTTQTTPFTVRLDPDGGYFKGQRYNAKFELAGYETAQVEIYPVMSAWYIGNLGFGGLIGFILVDPLTGCMWDMRPKHIDQLMVKLPEAAVPVPPPTPPAVNAPPDIVTPAVQAPTQSDSTNTVAPPSTPVPPPTPAPTGDTNLPMQLPPPLDSTNSATPPVVTPPVVP